MRNFAQFSLFSLYALLWSTQTTAAVGDIDLSRFIRAANRFLQNTYGAHALDPSWERVYFQDGVGTGMEPFFDFATLTYLRKVRIPLEDPAIDAVGFRLELNGNFKPVQVHFSKSGSGSRLVFAFPGTVLLAFKAETTSARLHEIEAQILKYYPKARIHVLESVGILQVDATPLEIPFIVQYIASEKEYVGVDLNFETYAFPAEFDRAQELDQVANVVDLDSFRTISAKYKKSGIPFATETTVPQIFKPEVCLSLGCAGY